MSDEHVHEDHTHEDHVHEEVQQMPRGPMVEYDAKWVNKKGQKLVINNVRGMQFDGGFYFLFVPVEGMPVPEIKVLDLNSPDVRDLMITPVRVIEFDA